MQIRNTGPLRREIARAIPDRPFRIGFWDGTTMEPTVARVGATPGVGGDGVPAFLLRSPRALAHALRAPGQLGIGRAYVSGDLEVSDLDGVIDILEHWKPPAIDGRERGRLMLAALHACGPTLPPKRPVSELVPRGTRHSRERDARAVRHHYDVPAEFFGLFLDESMTYSCGVFSKGAGSLEEAQETKLEMVCSKLGLAEGQHVLDVGCGWGSFAMHAATRHGVRVTGITLSSAQAEVAQRRVRDAGLSERVEIRVMDYRDLPGERFDAIASIGMVVHVGAEQIDVYAETLAQLLEPGGRLLNTASPAFATRTPTPARSPSATCFPTPTPCTSRASSKRWSGRGSPPTGSRSWPARAADRATGSPAATTQRRCATGRAASTRASTRRPGWRARERIRVWRLYLRAARNGFEVGFTSTYQVLCTRA